MKNCNGQEVTIRKTFKFKVLKQNRNRTKRLEDHLHIACTIYNHCIALHKRYYRLFKKYIDLNRMQKHIRKLKDSRFPEWKKLNSQVIQQICQRINNGYTIFFKELKKVGQAREKGEKLPLLHRPPTFRPFRKYRSITFKNSGWDLKGNTFIIRAIKLRLKFRLSRPIKGNIATVTLKRDSLGDWWLYFSVHMERERSDFSPRTGKSAGFDFGLKTYLTVSDSYAIESPQPLLADISKIRSANRSLSRKQKGSSNRERARLVLARAHRRVANVRNDFHWRLGRFLVENYDTVCFETLNINGMKRRWGRRVSDLGFSDFIRIIDHLCKKRGKDLVQIDRWEASTKTCSGCHFRVAEIPLKIREWKCPQCGALHDRDLNAALNILRVGTSTLSVAEGT